jgi:hypothetical protein
VKDRTGGFKVLRLTALRFGKIDLREYKEGDWEASEAANHVVRKGDFLLSRGNGSIKLVGRGGVVMENVDIAFPDTLKRKPLRLEDLREFIDCYNPANRHKRKATWHADKNPEGRWRKFTYDELVSRDKTSLDLFWLKDDGLADLDNLPEPADLAEEIIDNIEAGLLSFRAVAAALQPAL